MGVRIGGGAFPGGRDWAASGRGAGSIELSVGQIVPVYNRPGVALGLVVGVTRHSDGCLYYDMIFDSEAHFDSTYVYHYVPPGGLGYPISRAEPADIFRALTRDFDNVHFFVLLSELRRLMLSRINQERTRGR